MSKPKITKKKIILTIVLIIILLLVLFALFLNKKNILPNILNSKEKMGSNVELIYKKTKVNDEGTECSILLTIVADEGIEKIIEPDGEEITPIDGRTKLAIDYTINFEEDYEFKITDKTGTETPKILRVPTMGEIYTIEDLEDMNLWLYGNYKLMNDLDFKDRDSYATDECYEYYNKDEDDDGNPDNSWTPIGRTGFEGELDGDYHTISNLYIKNATSMSGLFSYTKNNANLFHIVLNKFYISGNSNNLGCLVGKADGNIYECKVRDSQISGRDYNGYLVGGGQLLERCVATDCNMICSTASGGLIGIGKAIDSYASGYVKSTKEYSWGANPASVWGISGYNEENCYSLVKLTVNWGSKYPLSPGTKTNSFYDAEYLEISSPDAYGKTTDEMKNQSTYTNAGWNFDTVWKMNSKTGYPMLQWEENIIGNINGTIRKTKTNIISKEDADILEHVIVTSEGFSNCTSKTTGEYGFCVGDGDEFLCGISYFQNVFDNDKDTIATIQDYSQIDVDPSAWGMHLYIENSANWAYSQWAGDIKVENSWGPSVVEIVDGATKINLWTIRGSFLSIGELYLESY